MKIPDHELVCRIGQGSYGEVWLARTVFGAYRAAKFLFRKTFRDPQPFLREIAGIERFEPISRSHPGFVHILHVGRNEAKDYVYYLMELADDASAGQEVDPETYTPKTLASEIARSRRLPLAECVQLAIDLTSALAHLHGNGLVHRDIKPSNIVFVRGAPKLADIGLVADLDEARSYVGTDGFIPPEGPGTAQADIYSLGKVLYEAATGNDRQQFPELPANLSEFEDVALFFEFNEIIVKAGDPNRERRYADAQTMLAELELLKAGRSVRKLRKRQRFAGLARRFAPTGMVAMLALGGVFAYAEYNRGAQRKLVEESVRSELSLASQAMDRGSHLEALPYLVNALRYEENDPARNRAHRMRIGSALAGAPKLAQVWLFPSAILKAEFSRDGQSVLIVTDQVELREVASGKTRVKWAPKQALRGAALSPDQKLLAMCDTHGEVSLWNDKRQFLRRLGLSAPATGARFNHAGDRVATAGADGTLRVFDVNGELVGSAPGAAGLLFAGFSPSDALIVTCARNGRVMLWDAKTFQRVGAAMDIGAVPVAASFNPEGSRLVVASNEGATRLWRVPSGEESSGVRTGASTTWAEFSPDGRCFVTSSFDGHVQFWLASQAIGAPRNPALFQAGPVQSACFAPDARRIVTAGADGAVRIWDLADAMPRPALLCLNDGTKFELPDLFAPMKCHLDGEAYLREACEISLADDARTVTVRPFSHEKAGSWEVRLLAPNTIENIFVDGHAHALASVLPNQIQIHTAALPDASPIKIENAGQVEAVAFGMNGTLFAFASGRVVRVFLLNGETATAAGSFQAPGGIGDIRFSKDGKQLLVCLEGELLQRADGKPAGAGDHSALIVDVTTSQSAKGVFTHNHQVSGSYASADKNAFLSVTGESMLRLWDSISGQPITPPLFGNGPLSAAAYLPDRASILALEANGGRAWLWKIPSEERPLAELQQLSALLTGQQARELWPALSTNRPSDFRARPHDIARWHLEAARVWEPQQRWTAAALHWRHVLEVMPANELASSHLAAMEKAQASP